jgi:polyribonucleotide nucleotidyltransferase
VKVNSEHHPKIIGRRGVTISKIRAEHDVNIQFPDRDSEDADIIVIKGYQDRAEAARDAILKIVEELEEQVTDEVEIDARVHSRLIGAKGKAIRKVMDQFSVDIRFPKDKESSIVTITGLEVNVEEAKDHLLNMEEEYVS